MSAARGRAGRRIPVVLTPGEVRLILEHLHGAPRLAALLMYGAGLRLMECMQLRVKDIDFDRHQIVVRAGKGGKDRVTVLPASAVGPLRRQLEMVQQQHPQDVRRGGGWVEVPPALARKYPNAGRRLAWQWVMPATRAYLHPETGQRRRHHYHETAMQRAFRRAVIESGITKQATCHSLRHYPGRRIIPSRDLNRSGGAFEPMRVVADSG